MRKMAIVRIQPDILRELLRLPDDAKIVFASMCRYEYPTIELTIEGVGWGTDYGDYIRVAPNAEITKDGIDWKLPK